MLAQVQYYYHLPNLEGYSDEKIIELFVRLQWVRQKEKEEWDKRFNSK